MKPCIRCGNTQPLENYYSHPQMGDGHLNKCKNCCKADAREHHHRSAEKPEWIEAQRKRGREKYHRLYRGKVPMRTGPEAPDPVKRAARVALGNAVRDGRLEKPEYCQECGVGGRIEGHHTDYGKPLEVMWLCSLCHGLQHRKEAA